ncbi:hypothetical protein Ahy_A10g051117 isoform A [Arachis hypogaea]|uniref:Uncharacterized protein n=1 Tax=Arachis hypogaea TaxID=3818 RepID=A0A445BBK6_ARAHY|nr:hypothetical protein Ahy_A10g051117 isoform A [Arachis hypogaea]
MPARSTASRYRACFAAGIRQGNTANGCWNGNRMDPENPAPAGAKLSCCGGSGGVGVAVPAGRFDGAALAGAAVVVLNDDDVVIVVVVGIRKGEVGLSLWATELSSGGVVCTRCVLGGVEGAEPNAALLAWISDLSSVPSPWPLPNTPKMYLFNAGATFAVNLNGSRLIPGSHNEVWI